MPGVTASYVMAQGCIGSARPLWKRGCKPGVTASYGMAQGCIRLAPPLTGAYDDCGESPNLGHGKWIPWLRLGDS